MRKLMFSEYNSEIFSNLLGLDEDQIELTFSDGDWDEENKILYLEVIYYPEDWIISNCLLAIKVAKTPETIQDINDVLLKSEIEEVKVIPTEETKILFAGNPEALTGTPFEKYKDQKHKESWTSKMRDYLLRKEMEYNQRYQKDYRNFRFDGFALIKDNENSYRLYFLDKHISRLKISELLNAILQILRFERSLYSINPYQGG